MMEIKEYRYTKPEKKVKCGLSSEFFFLQSKCFGAWRGKGHGDVSVPKPKGYNPGSEEGREEAAKRSRDDHTSRRSQRFQAVEHVDQMCLRRGTSQGRENGKLSHNPVRVQTFGTNGTKCCWDRIQEMTGPLFFPVFRIAPLRAP